MKTERQNVKLNQRRTAPHAANIQLPAALRLGWSITARACFCALLLATDGAAPRVFAAPAPPRFRSDRVLVKPRDGVPAWGLTNLHATVGAKVLRLFPHIGNWEVLQIPPTAPVSNVLAAYQRSGQVQLAEPDYLVQLAATPNDFHFLNGDQWNLVNVGQYGGTPAADIDATNGWDIQTSASNVIVAVVDTGIRYTHEDLAPNMWHNPQLNADGYTNDLYGINLVNNGRGSGDPWDDYGHGTHVAGIIGATGDNGVGIAGVCWQVQLMALKFIDANGIGSITDAITCLDYARSHGAKVVNASWGSYGFTSVALWDAVNSLRDAGIIVVAAAGNSATDNDTQPLYPANYCATLDNVIAVAATDRNDNLAFFSDYGSNTVQLAAPGCPVFSCWNGSDSDYQYYQGTSMAAPHVVGACALVWGAHPGFTALQVIHQVVNGVDRLPSLAGKCESGGRLNLFDVLIPPLQQGIPPATNIWVEDSLPAGAVATTVWQTNYDATGNPQWVEQPWAWVTNNPTPFSGIADDMEDYVPGIHRQSFINATSTLPIYSGDTLFVYAYLDPANPPDEVMVEWTDGSWEHRAFWGADVIPWGEYGTSGRLDMGNLPPAGQWMRLAVPASALKLEGGALTGISFMLHNGQAAWDYAGRTSSSP